MDEVKNQMEGVTRTYLELDNKIADKGGVQNLFGMNRKLRQALESITIDAPTSSPSKFASKPGDHPWTGFGKFCNRLTNSPTKPTSMGTPTR